MDDGGGGRGGGEGVEGRGLVWMGGGMDDGGREFQTKAVILWGKMSICPTLGIEGIIDPESQTG